MNTIQGVITACPWERTQDEKAIQISGEDEKDYRIVLDQNGKKLINLLRRHVRVTGFINDTEKTPSLTVSHYELLD